MKHRQTRRRSGSSLDRMRPIPARRMTRAQKEAAREIIAGKRGGLYGPFGPALRSPEFMTRLQKVGEYLRYESVLEPRLKEMVILLTARDWTQHFEWYVHAPEARRSGLKASVIQAIADGRRPDPMADDEAIVYDVFMELQRHKAVSDRTYARAITAFAEQGVIDLVGTAGYYAALAMIMNVARTPLPAGETPVLEPLP